MHAQTPARKLNAGTQALGLFGLCLALIAACGPSLAQSPLYHHFADQRTLLGIPHALDVLSNLPFLLLGLLGLGRLQRIAEPRWRGLALLLSLGLFSTCLGSGVYHLAPGDSGLLYDRLGMLVLFAAILGLAAADRLGFAAARLALGGVLLAGAASLWVWWALDNLLPWVVLQAGGMLMLLALAFCRPLHSGYALRLGLCLACYVLAKLCELGDAQLFRLSGELLSGHSLKHLFAGLAVLPMLLPLVANGRAAS